MSQFSFDTEKGINTFTPIGLGDDVTPQGIVVFYGRNNDLKQEILYAEYHKRLKNKISCGKPLRVKDVQTLVSQFDIEKVNGFYCSDMIPNRLLIMKTDKLVWYRTPQKTLVRTSEWDKEVQLPYLVFALESSGELHVHAAKSKPKKDSQLYHAPLWNINFNGRVCLGSTKSSKSKDVDKVIEETEKYFFDSKFTHLSHNEFKMNVNEIYKLAETKFPNQSLVKSIRL